MESGNGSNFQGTAESWGLVKDEFAEFVSDLVVGV